MEYQNVEKSENAEITPEAGRRVDNTVIWIIAIMPVVTYFFGRLWLFPFTLMYLLAFYDMYRLKKAEHDISTLIAGALLFLPVYLFQRAKLLNQEKSYFGVMLVCISLTMLLNIAATHSGHTEIKTSKGDPITAATRSNYTEMKTPKDNPVPAATQKTETKTEYIASTKKIGGQKSPIFYKDFLKNPSKYQGQRINI